MIPPTKVRSTYALPARIILGAWDGLTTTEIARRKRVSLPAVGKWRSRYAGEKMEALADAPRSGAPRSIDDKKGEEMLTKTLEGTLGLAPTRAVALWKQGFPIIRSCELGAPLDSSLTEWIPSS